MVPNFVFKWLCVFLLLFLFLVCFVFWLILVHLFCLFVFYREKEGMELDIWMGGDVRRIWEEMRENCDKNVLYKKKIIFNFEKFI